MNQIKMQFLDKKMLFWNLILMSACSTQSSDSVTPENIHENNERNHSQEISPQPLNELEAMFGLKVFDNDNCINALITLLWKAYSLVPNELVKLKEYAQNSSEENFKKELGHLFQMMPETSTKDSFITPMKDLEAWNVKYTERNKKKGPLNNIIINMQNDIEIPRTKKPQGGLLKELLEIFMSTSKESPKSIYFDFLDTFSFVIVEKNDTNASNNHTQKTETKTAYLSIELKASSDDITSIIKNDLSTKEKTPKFIFIHVNRSKKKSDLIKIDNAMKDIQINFLNQKEDETPVNYKLQGVSCQKNRKLLDEVLYTDLKTYLKDLNTTLNTLSVKFEYYERRAENWINQSLEVLQGKISKETISSGPNGDEFINELNKHGEITFFSKNVIQNPKPNDPNDPNDPKSWIIDEIGPKYTNDNEYSQILEVWRKITNTHRTKETNNIVLKHKNKKINEIINTMRYAIDVHKVLISLTTTTNTDYIYTHKIIRKLDNEIRSLQEGPGYTGAVFEKKVDLSKILIQLLENEKERIQESHHRYTTYLKTNDEGKWTVHRNEQVSILNDEEVSKTIEEDGELFLYALDENSIKTRTP